jgi:endonuclease YncB( thermonuclease family)
MKKFNNLFTKKEKKEKNNKNEKNDKKLIESTNSNTDLYSLNGIICPSKIVSIYDGDTCTCNILLPDGKITKYKVRLHGYDSPEIRPSRNAKDRNTIIKNAKIARNYLASVITDQDIELEKMYTKKEFQKILDNNKKIITIKCLKWDKYGRLLGSLYIDEEDESSVNELMILKEYGYSYDGGTKKVIPLISSESDTA